MPFFITLKVVERPAAKQVEIFCLFQGFPPVLSVTQSCGVCITDLLPLPDPPHGSHPAPPVGVDGVLRVGAAAGVHQL